MPSLTVERATSKLIEELATMTIDDLEDFYHEVFPDQPKPDLSGSGGSDERSKILAYLKDAPAPEEILDFWNSVFPSSTGVRFDEEDGKIHYRTRIPKTNNPG